MALACGQDGAESAGAASSAPAPESGAAQEPALTPEDDPAAGAARPRFFRLDVSDPFLEVETVVEGRRVRSEPPGRRSQERQDRASQVTERLGFSLEGYAFAPDVLRFGGDLSLGFSQARFHETVNGFDRTDSDSGTLQEFDLSLDLFPARPVSATAYARRTRDRIPRRFLPSLQEDREEAGGSLLLTTDDSTTDVGFDGSDVRRTGNVALEDDESREQDRFHVDHEWDISDAQRLRLRYHHDRDRSRYQGSLGSLDTRRDEAQLEHEWAFGPDGRHRWDLLLRYNDEQGDLARDEIEVAPRLTFQHSDHFKTAWRYNFYKVDQDRIDTRQHKLDAQAVWQPGPHLRLTGDLFWRYERVERDVETYEYGGLLDLHFEHPTHLGSLAVDASVNLIRAEITGDGPLNTVRGEQHALDTVRPAILREPDIDRFSIVAYDATRTRVFVPGLDYKVTTLGRLTMVRRVLSGRIADDEPVLFDYRYRIPTGARRDTYQTDLRIEHAFAAGITPYYLWQNRREFVDGPELRRAFALGWFDPVFEDFTDNTDHHRMGVRWERDRWSVTGEFEIFNDSVLPYEAWHVTGQVGLARTPAHALDATAQFSHYRFDGDFDRRRVNFFDLDVKDRMQLTDDLSATAGLGYRYERDSVDGMTHGLDIEGTIRLTRGLLDVELTAEYDVLNIGDHEERGYGLWLNVRRDLSDAWGRLARK